MGRRNRPDVDEIGTARIFAKEFRWIKYVCYCISTVLEFYYFITLIALNFSAYVVTWTARRSSGKSKTLETSFSNYCWDGYEFYERKICVCHIPTKVLWKTINILALITPMSWRKYQKTACWYGIWKTDGNPFANS